MTQYICSWSMFSLSQGKGRLSMSWIKVDSPKCLGCHGFVLRCVNLCPHPKPIPVFPRNIQFPSLFKERRRSIFLAECILHTTRFGNLFCPDLHRVPSSDTAQQSQTTLDPCLPRTHGHSGLPGSLQVLVVAAILPSSY